MSEATPILETSTEGQPVVLVPFSAYELANVAEMFRAIIADNPDCIFAAFNSGDWTNVVAWRFADAEKRYANGYTPNKSADYYRDGVLERSHRALTEEVGRLRLAANIANDALQRLATPTRLNGALDDAGEIDRRCLFAQHRLNDLRSSLSPSTGKARE